MWRQSWKISLLSLRIELFHNAGYWSKWTGTACSSGLCVYCLTCRIVWRKRERERERERGGIWANASERHHIFNVLMKCSFIGLQNTYVGEKVMRSEMNKVKRWEVNSLFFYRSWAEKRICPGSLRLSIGISLLKLRELNFDDNIPKAI
jgi:hypothetical protein